MKFAVGDRVKINGSIYHGQQGQIIAIDITHPNHMYYKVWLVDDSTYFGEQELEKV